MKLKQSIEQYYTEIQADYEPEEISSCLVILSEYDDYLRGLSTVDATILSRIVDDEDILNEIEVARVERVECQDNPFRVF